MKSKKDIQKRIKKLEKIISIGEITEEEFPYFNDCIKELRWVLDLKPKQLFEDDSKQGGGF